jgi:hypothetical protein
VLELTVRFEFSVLKGGFIWALQGFSWLSIQLECFLS